jgi:hypothetical protein
LSAFLEVARVASSQVASAAPMDKAEVLDGAALDDPSREPKPVPGAFSMLDRSDRGIATKLPSRARSGHAHTLSYLIFNAPQIAAIRASVPRGSAGAVTNPAGRLKLDGAWAPVSYPMARARS